MMTILFQIILLLAFIAGWHQGIKKMQTSTENFSKTNNPIRYILGLDE